MYVNDMVALEKDILAALEKQKDDERVQSDPKVASLVSQLRDTTKAHLLTMENHAAAMGGDTGGAIKEAVASVAGTLAGIYDLVRKHPVSRMLRDDYTALSLKATAYSMLYTTGLTLRETPIANVALRHLNETTPLVMALSAAIPGVVVRELAQDGLDVDTSATSLAEEKTQAAWGAAKA
jgi:ferritin-like metal-binding protein YciE